MKNAFVPLCFSWKRNGKEHFWPAKNGFLQRVYPGRKKSLRRTADKIIHGGVLAQKEMRGHIGFSRVGE